MLKINALIRFHFLIEPESLEDEEWARRYNELMWIFKAGYDLPSVNGLMK